MSYHSLKPLINFFSSINLEVVDFDLIEAQGGSIRVYVGHKNKGNIPVKIQKQINIEKKFGLFSVRKYLNYFKKIMNQKNKIGILIKKNIKKNKVFIGYGAPAKVTTFCHVFDIGKKEIQYIVDDNDLKQNKFTPGKNIKILNFNKLRNKNFDYIIILAWNFADSIIKKLKKDIKGKKFKIVVPFPNLKII